MSLIMHLRVVHRIALSFLITYITYYITALYNNNNNMFPVFTTAIILSIGVHLRRLKSNSIHRIQYFLL